MHGSNGRLGARDRWLHSRMPTWVRSAGLLLAAVVLQATAGYAQTVLFTDNFEDGAADGWTTYQGTWAVVVDGTSVYRQSGLSSKYRAAAGSAAWTDYVVEARVKPTGWNGSDRFASLVARFQDANNMYALALRSSNKVALIKIASGSNTALAQTAYSVALTPGTRSSWRSQAARCAGTSTGSCRSPRTTVRLQRGASVRAPNTPARTSMTSW